MKKLKWDVLLLITLMVLASITMTFICYSMISESITHLQQVRREIKETKNWTPIQATVLAANTIEKHIPGRTVTIQHCDMVQLSYVYHQTSFTSQLQLVDPCKTELGGLDYHRIVKNLYPENGVFTVLINPTFPSSSREISFLKRSIRFSEMMQLFTSLMISALPIFWILSIFRLIKKTSKKEVN